MVKDVYLQDYQMSRKRLQKKSIDDNLGQLVLIRQDRLLVN